MENSLSVLNENSILTYLTADEAEIQMIKKASQLLSLNYPEHSLLEIWNASIHNLRRRIELYSIDIFLSTINSINGRKNYKKDGDTLSERWEDVDDFVLLQGASQIGVLNKKASKALEMVNWMRNHASPAHNSDESATTEDVVGLAAIIKKNIFDHELPDPAHSPVTLLERIKCEQLTEEQLDLFKEQIDNFTSRDIRTIFGYSVDVICSGKQPEYNNVLKLFINIWNKATEELKINMGLRLYNYKFDPGTDKSSDGLASNRIYSSLLTVDGVKYIPEQVRVSIYRKLAKDLAKAKDTSYGWSLENSASKALNQVGVHIPSTAFEDVYQEILSVWCGNYWGRSEGHIILHDFIFNVDHKKQVKIAWLFVNNERAKNELWQSKPKKYALELLDQIKNNLTNESQIYEIDSIIMAIKKF